MYTYSMLRSLDEVGVTSTQCIMDGEKAASQLKFWEHLTSNQSPILCSPVVRDQFLYLVSSPKLKKSIALERLH